MRSFPDEWHCTIVKNELKELAQNFYHDGPSPPALSTTWDILSGPGEEKFFIFARLRATISSVKIIYTSLSLVLGGAKGITLRSLFVKTDEKM